MNLEPRIDILAEALADRTRARIVGTLMDGRAFTAKELAYGAGVTPQTASFHLKLLKDRGLISVIKSGRAKYHRLAGPEIARLIEQLSALTPADHLRRAGPRGAPESMLLARSCYDHVAGRLGVMLADRLLERGDIVMREGEPALSDAGKVFFGDLGIGPETLAGKRRVAVRCCLDWTERRHHFAGGLPAALLALALDKGWLERRRETRILDITPLGYTTLERRFGLSKADLHGHGAPSVAPLTA